jgi:ribosome-binding protein aMBF1 (putative translation factor)
MIQNEREYKISKAEAEKFKQAILQLEQQSTEDWKIKLQRNAMQSSLEELEQDILEYSQLKNSPVPITLTLSSLEQIPNTLIQARIAKGWTQAELANRMGVKPQQVQNDEITQYQSANFARLTRVAKVLGMQFETARIMVG